MMTDREKVIKGLETCAGTNTDGTADCVLECPYKGSFMCIDRLMYDALDLLKEQPDIVRCNDCRHYKDGFCYNPNTYDDEKTKGNTVPDWFCADGERRVK